MTFIILASNYRQLLQFTAVFFFVSANIITVGQGSLTIKELERSRQNQANTLALSASSNTNMVAVALKAELRHSFLYSSSDWTVSTANFIVTNYRQRMQIIKVNG